MPQTLSTAELRRQNRNLIYHYLYHAKEPVTKQAISNTLSMSLPTVTQNFRDLMESGLIRWGHTLQSTGGRKPKTIEIVADARIAIGVEIAKETIRLVAVDLRGTRIADALIYQPFSCSEEYYALLSTEIERLIDTHHLNRDCLLGVGITLPGIVNAQTGMLEIAPSLNVREVNLDPLFQRIPYPVRLENDATAGGRAEGWNFHDDRLRAYLSVGEGIGGCILFGSDPYLGQNGRAAEFGHMRIVPNGRLCQCGKHGCLEAYCSTTRLSTPFHCSLEGFFMRLRERTPRYSNAWEDYLDSLALGINNIRMTLDCDIVLGGKLSQHLASYLGDLTSRLREMDSFESSRSYLSLSRMGPFTNAMGCALSFVQDFIRNI